MPLYKQLLCIICVFQFYIFLLLYTFLELFYNFKKLRFVRI